MKKLLLPTLAIALACLPAKAQQPAEPAIASAPPAPVPTAETARPHSSAPVLRERVQFAGAKLPEIVDFLNTKLKKQGEVAMNLVLGPGLDDVLVPAMTLQNVSAIDVMNVVAKLAGLSMESVPADSGGIAAWILTKRNSVEMAGGFGVTIGGSMGGEGGSGAVSGMGGEGGSVAFFGSPSPMLTPPGATPGGAGQVAGGGGGSGLAGAPSADAFAPVAPMRKGGKWIDAAAPQNGSAQISRVVGIGKIFEDFPTPEDRTKLEFDLADRLSVMAKDQKMECQVKFYESLRVIVLKGTPEGVALIEQTVAAMKENAGGKKPAAVTSPLKF